VVKRNFTHLVIEVENNSEDLMKVKWPLQDFVNHGVYKNGQILKYVIQFRSFKIEGYLNQELMITVNKKNFLNMEFERNMREHYRHYNKVLVDSSYKYQFDIN
jgi:hypothetical protein